MPLDSMSRAWLMVLVCEVSAGLPGGVRVHVAGDKPETLPPGAVAGLHLGEQVRAHPVRTPIGNAHVDHGAAPFAVVAQMGKPILRLSGGVGLGGGLPPLRPK